MIKNIIEKKSGIKDWHYRWKNNRRRSIKAPLVLVQKSITFEAGADMDWLREKERVTALTLDIAGRERYENWWKHSLKAQELR